MSGLVAYFRYGSEVKVGKEKRRRRRGLTQTRSPLALGFFSFVEVEVDKRVVSVFKIGTPKKTRRKIDREG